MGRGLVLVASVLIAGCGRGPTPPPSQSPEAGSEATPAAAPAAGEAQGISPAPPPVAPAPASEPPRATTEVLTGEDELTRAERELAEADQALAGATETSAAAEERDDGAPGRGAAPTKPKSSAPQQTPCTTTCKAFASLVRARDSICRIDGSDGERCSRANQIVERHTARSTSCGCS